MNTRGEISYTSKMIAAEVYDGRLKAHEKHKANSIEAKRGDDYLFFLACLGEEFGEVASTLTYDKDSSELRAELLDLICVATAWVAALDRA